MGSARRIVLAVTAAAAALLLAASLLQYETGWPMSREISLEIEEDGKREGLGVRARIPRDGRGELTDFRGRLLQDGAAIGTRVESNSEVKEHGLGRYRFNGHLLWFSTTDGSDPTNNGRRYSLQVPLEISFLVPAAAFACLLVAAGLLSRDPGAHYRADSIRARISFAPTWPISMAVIAVALAAGVWDVAVDGSTYSDGGFAVRGMPYSDAMGWNQLAVSLSEGRGLEGPFDGHRPFYAVVLGALYLLTGPSIAMAKGLNVVCLAAEAFFAFALAARATSRTLGIGIAAFVIVSSRYQDHLHTLLPGPLGAALSAASLFLFWRGINSDRPFLLFLSGGLLAFANLAQTFTLPALLPFVIVAAIAAATNGSQEPGGRRRLAAVAVPALSLVAGTLVVLSPWIVRQKLTYGVTAISANGADILYGTTMDGEPVELSPHTYGEAKAAGVPDHVIARSDFFTGRFRETVMAAPDHYARHVVDSSLHFFRSFPLGGGADRFYAVGFALLACIGISFRTGSLSALAGFGIVWPAVEILVGFPPLLALTLCSAFAFWKGGRPERLMIASALSLLTGCAIAVGLSGGSDVERFASFRHWIFALLIFAGVRHGALVVAKAIASLRGKTLRLPTDAGAITARIATVGAMVTAALCLVATAGILVRHVMIPPVPPFEVEIPSRLETEIRARFSGTADGGDSSPTFIALMTPGLYRTVLPAGDTGGHWARPFAPQPFARTVAFHDMSGPDYATIYPCELPALDDGTTYILVGDKSIDPNPVLHHDPVLIHARSLIPYDVESAMPLWDEALLFESPSG